MSPYERRQDHADLRELIETLREIEASGADARTRRAAQELVDKLLESSAERRRGGQVPLLLRPGTWLRRLGRCA